MRKTNLFGATFLALATASMPFTVFAQAPATTSPAPAPMTAAPPPAAAPAPADVTPAAPPAPDASAPAASSAKPMKKKPMHHKRMMSHKGGKLVATKAGDKAVEDLNDASLSSAKSGKTFAAPTTPEAAKEPAHAGMHKKMSHHVAKKKMTTTAPSGDEATTTTTTTTPNTDAPK